MSPLIYISAAFLLLLTLWIKRRLHHISFFKRLGIPGPEPSIFTGNLYDVINKGVAKCQLEWTRKYGNIVGYYVGMRPIILILDKELMHTVQVKDSFNFNAKELLSDTIGIPDERVESSLPVTTGERWKKIRGVLTPAFSTAKLKQILQVFEVKTDIFLDNLSKLDLTKDVEIAKRIDLLTVDTILTSALGVDTNVQNDPNDKMFQSIKKIFGFKYSNLSFMLPACLPEFSKVFFKLDCWIDWINEKILNKPSIFFSFQKCQEAIDMRKQGSHNKKDLLQLMINEIKESSNKSQNDQGHLNDDALISNAIVMVGAGYETVSSLLSFTCHLLVHYPEVQEKMKEEIFEKINANKPTYEDLNELKYMDQVLSESLRYFPPSLTAVTRKNKESFKFENISFPKNCSFQVPIFALHRYPKYWPDPDKFDPERFSVERKGEIENIVYQPFGHGPRNCIGLRYALVEAKYIMARILQNYKLEKCSKTEKVDFEIEDKLFIIQPQNGIWLKLTKI